MRTTVSVQLLRAGGLAAILFLISFFLSANSITQWNGAPCLPGTQNGFPLPISYTVDRSTSNPPPVTGTPSCPSGVYAVGGVNVLNGVLDYLFWFAVSLPIVLLTSWLFSRMSVKVGEGPEKSGPDISTT